MYPIFNPHQAQNKSLAQAGIDPCHINLKHFDLTSTPPGLWLKSVSFLSYLILVFHIVANFQPSSSSKQVVGTGGNRSLSHQLERLWLDLYTTRVIAEVGFFSFTLNSRFPHVPNFQPSSSSKQVVGTGWNRSLSRKLETLWLDFYTTRVIAEVGFFSIILNTRFLHCSQLSTLIKLKTIGWHRRESIHAP